MASTLAASVATPTVAAVAARHRAPSHRLWSDVGKCPVPVQVQWGARDRYLEEIAIPPADARRVGVVAARCAPSASPPETEKAAVAYFGCG